MKHLIALFAALLLLTACCVPVSAVGFVDIPAESTLQGEIERANEYGLMNGYTATTFGYYDSVTRAQFVTVLGRMMGWFDGAHTDIGHVTDAMEVSYPQDVSAEYWTAINRAVEHDVVDTYLPFRPRAAITRAEMSEMLVRAMGLKTAGQSLNSNRMFPGSDTVQHTPFTDLTAGNEGYIAVAYAIGMTKGTTATTFSPNGTATRAQAAAMLVRMYEKLQKNMSFTHAFYAISSYNQIELAERLDAVSVGWSRMTWDGSAALLSTTSADGNEYAIPSGYQDALSRLEAAGTAVKLSVFMDGDSLKKLLASESGRTQAVEQIVNELTVSYKTVGKNPYSGVTIDFEGFGAAQRENFISFLSALAPQVQALGKSLYVCVQPVPLSSTITVNTNGYDYASIGKLADKVILMAHDYDPRNLDSYVGAPNDIPKYYQHCPTAPLTRIFMDLRDVAEQMDPSKVMLAFSGRNIAWKIDENDKLISGTPVSVASDIVSKRLAQADTVHGWDAGYQQSYAIYSTEDGSRYFLWYQDAHSVALELQAAKLLGIGGISLWRLGVLPDYDNWNWDCLYPIG